MSAMATMPSATDVGPIVRAFYEQVSFPGYEEFETVMDLVRKAQEGAYARRLDEDVPLGVSILDAGCGTGQLATFLSLTHRHAVGVDFSLNSLRQGVAFKRRESLRNVHFVQMNLFASCLRTASFDYVFCNGVLHHTGDAFGGFRDLCRVLKPGGFIVIGLYNTYGRLFLDLRRLIFRLTGDRLQLLDYFMRRRSLGKAKKRIWFLDQYRNPHETKFAVADVLRWFADCGIDYVNSVPPINRRAVADGPLFARRPVGTPLEHLMAQLGWIFTEGRVGGFFIIIGQKIGGTS